MDTLAEPNDKRRATQPLRFRDVVWQFKRDVYDKEVQSAATYSYLWLADQMGHIGVGILLILILGLVFQLLPVSKVERVVWPWCIALCICVIWEIGAYRTFAAKATRIFRPDTKMLRSNAIVATTYMALGIALGAWWQAALLFSSQNALRPGHDLMIGLAIGVTVLCTVIALRVAYPWVRQKMLWQKAGMPFLFRLANARNTISCTDAQKLQTYLDTHLRAVRDRSGPTRPVIISGPLWAGKTSLACGIGTEAAFGKLRVRYVTFDKLRQMADSKEGDDLGPKNIVYWRWKESDVLIVDDIDSGPSSDDAAIRNMFTSVTENYGLPGCFAGILTIWLIGHKNKEDLTQWQEVIANACKRAGSDGTEGKPEILTICLSLPDKAASQQASSQARLSH